MVGFRFVLIMLTIHIRWNDTPQSVATPQYHVTASICAPEGSEMRNKQKGFSLIELLIVVAIILIIAAISIPNLLHAKMSANEASAVGSLRALTTACMAYDMPYGGYPPALSNLGPGNPATSATADLIDSVLASGSKSGYRFTYTAGAKDANGNVLSYTINADPIAVGTTGQRQVFTDETGVIRVNSGGPAGKNSSPIN